MTDYKPNVTKSIDNLNELEEKINNLQEKSVTYTEGGNYTIEPDENYFAIKKVNVDVDIAPSVQAIEIDYEGLKNSQPSSSGNANRINDRLKRITLDCTGVKNLNNFGTNIGTTLTSLHLSNTNDVVDFRGLIGYKSNFSDINELNLQSALYINMFTTTIIALTDDSLQNILKSLLTLNPDYSGDKTLKSMGLNSIYMEKITTFPEWATLSANGWTTGY